MKKIFVITYSGNNSADIEQAVKSFSSWFHFTKDVFLISEDATAKQIQSRLETKILQGKEKLLVIEVEIKDVQGWLQKNEWDWLKSVRSQS